MELGRPNPNLKPKNNFCFKTMFIILLSLFFICFSAFWVILGDDAIPYIIHIYVTLDGP